MLRALHFYPDRHHSQASGFREPQAPNACLTTSVESVRTPQAAAPRDARLARMNYKLVLTLGAIVALFALMIHGHKMSAPAEKRLGIALMLQAIVLGLLGA